MCSWHRVLRWGSVGRLSESLNTRASVHKRNQVMMTDSARRPLERQMLNFDFELDRIYNLNLGELSLGRAEGNHLDEVR